MWLANTTNDDIRRLDRCWSKGCCIKDGHLRAGRSGVGRRWLANQSTFSQHDDRCSSKGDPVRSRDLIDRGDHRREARRRIMTVGKAIGIVRGWYRRQNSRGINCRRQRQLHHYSRTLWQQGLD